MFRVTRCTLAAALITLVLAGCRESVGPPSANPPTSAPGAPAPAAFRMVRVGGDGQSVEEGSSPTDSLVIKVLDRFDNPVSNVVVNWSVVTGGGTLAPATATTDGQGVAKARWALPVVGKNVARAAAAGVTPVTFDVTVTPAARPAFASTNAGYFYSCGVATGGAA